MTRKQVSLWCTAFAEGRTNVEDDHRSGRPCSSSTDDNIAQVDNLIQADRRCKIRDIALELDISKAVAHEIVHEKLGYRKVSRKIACQTIKKCKRFFPFQVSARWVPKELTEGHKSKRFDASTELLNRYGSDSESLKNVITGDEAWVHHHTQESKRDSMTWKHPSPVPKKFKVQQSAKKLMATIFWDAQGILLADFTPPGQTVNAARYCETLAKLKEAIRRKRPGQLRDGVVLLHDNATPHTANLTQQWLQRFGWETLPHPPHSPDLAPSDFHLFGPLKRHLSGLRFDTDEDLITDVKGWLRSLDAKFFNDGMFALLHRWQKCIDLNGDYVEK